MALLLVAALLMDECFAEAKRFHPLVGFGNYALFLERRLNATDTQWPFMLGCMCWCLAVVPIVLLTVVGMWLLSLYAPSWLYYVVSAAVLYFTIGQKSLKQHGQAVAKPLADYLSGKSDESDKQNSLHASRYALSMIVSRDTEQATPEQIATGTIETITENTHDAVIGPLVFFVLFGAPGAVLFRLANTLDAMWGYRTERYERFGKCAARADDVLGYVPARITSLLMALSHPIHAINVFKSIFLTGRRWYSPNAGLVMAAGAGALNIRLGGDAVYQGTRKTRLTLGLDNQSKWPTVNDIQRSIWLMYQTSVLFVVMIWVYEGYQGFEFTGGYLL